MDDGCLLLGAAPNVWRDAMRNLLATCAVAVAVTAGTLFAPAPAQAWGYRHFGLHRPFAYVYRPYAYVYRPRLYAWAYRPYWRYAYRPYAYRAYAYSPGPRIWLGWRPRRWWW